jgi:hypothetical protein
MKNIVSLVLGIIFLVLTSSCVSQRHHSSWQEYPPAPFLWQYRTDKVSVIVDHVREDNIAQQIKIIAETHLESRQQHNRKNDKTIFLDITVEQRSFMQNVEMYNSIYVSCVAHDGEETVYAKENEYISGKKTFIAVPEQKIIITRILDRFLNEQQKRYKDIEKYEQEMDPEK